MMGLLLGKRERLRREASDWLARLHGSPGQADREAFERWYADPERADAFERVKARYVLAGLLTEPGAERVRPRRRPQRSSPMRAYAMAAAFAALVLASGVVLIGRPAGLSPANAETLHFATGIGEIREVALPDGSRLTLDTETRVRVDIGRSLRRITLGGGRVRLVVARDETRPFTVRTDKARVTASDSTFDMAVSGDGAIIHLLEGSASVEAIGASSSAEVARLKAGEVIQVSSSGERLHPRPFGRAQALWPTGRLEFDATPLDAAIAEANRYSRMRIGLGDAGLSELKVTGTFQAGDVEGLARSLAAAFDLALHRPASNELILRPAEAREGVPEA